jgi:hypothetical protein
VQELASQRFTAVRPSGQPSPGQALARTLREQRPANKSPAAKPGSRSR